MVLCGPDRSPKSAEHVDDRSVRPREPVANAVWTRRLDTHVQFVLEPAAEVLGGAYRTNAHVD
jgi:hypothetical protein